MAFAMTAIPLPECMFLYSPPMSTFSSANSIDEVEAAAQKWLMNKLNSLNTHFTYLKWLLLAVCLWVLITIDSKQKHNLTPISVW